MSLCASGKPDVAGATQEKTMSLCASGKPDVAGATQEKNAVVLKRAAQGPASPVASRYPGRSCSRELRYAVAPRAT